MTISEINESVKQLRADNKAMRDAAQAEKRALTGEELDKINTNISKITEMNEERAAQVAELSKKEEGEKRNNKGLAAQILDALENNKRSFSIDVTARESRAVDFDVTGGKSSASLVPTMVLDIMQPLRDRMVLGQAGATYLTGLQGNINIPSYSGSQVGWAGENGSAASGAGEFSYLQLSPKRLTAVIEVSRQLLLQAPAGLDAMLQNDLVAAVANKLEKTILGSGAGSANEPAGIFNKATAVTLSHDAVVDLEELADTANAITDDAMYLMSTAAWAKAKTTTKNNSIGAGFLLEADKTMNGYRAQRSNSVAGIAFGEWKEMVIGQWGAIEVIVDPITKAGEDIVRIITNSHWDAGVRRPGAIQAKTITA